MRNGPGIAGPVFLKEKVPERGGDTPGTLKVIRKN